MPKDYSKAAYWYKMAAEQGHSEAQYFLGEYYSREILFPETNAEKIKAQKNKEESIKWFKKAAEQGNQRAIKKLEKSNK